MPQYLIAGTPGQLEELAVRIVDAIVGVQSSNALVHTVEDRVKFAALAALGSCEFR